MFARTPRGGAFGKIGLSARGTSVLLNTGLFKPVGPGKLRQIHQQYQRYGLTIPLAYASGALRYPERAAIIDDRGPVGYAELEETSTRLAHGLRSLGPKDGLLKIGLLARNHRLAVQTCLAAGKLGADLILLNPGLADRQIRAVLAEQRIDVVVVDEDLLPLLEHFPKTVRPVVGWLACPGKPPPSTGDPWFTAEALIRHAPATELPDPRRIGKTVLLTSGTTGVPKGALRPVPRSLTTIAGLLDVVPLRAGETMVLPPPLFHLLGFSFLQLAAMLGNTVVLHREFDAETTLRDVARYGATTLIASPIMLQRMVERSEDATDHRTGYDTRSLRVALSSGAPLPGPLAARLLDEFGPVLYNVYGSTEVSWATVATPRDLAQAPDTAGRPPPGTRVAIVDGQGRPAATGQVGRIFVGNEMLFDGYTRPNAEFEVRRGMLRTGDLGCFDSRGRLFISGREDDMVIAGGENVFPKEVENLLCHREDVREAAAFGVPDAEYGQRLRAYVVPEPGARISPEEIRHYVARNLAEMSVPREVVLIQDLPRNAAGKVVRGELHEHRSGTVPAPRQASSRVRRYQHVSRPTTD